MGRVNVNSIHQARGQQHPIRALSSSSAADAGISSTDEHLKRTALYDCHLKCGGKMVPFAGHSLPVMYTGTHGGIKAEHLQVRQSAGLFDVSHMGQVRVYGKDRVRFLEHLVVADVEALPVGRATLSLMTNVRGCIIDDTIVTQLGRDRTGRDALGMVINGACVEKDMAHILHEMNVMRNKTGMEVDVERLEDRSLLALQGPKAMHVLGRMISNEEIDLKRMPFMSAETTRLASLHDEVLVTRCGYTGEDGFEISVNNADAPILFDQILEHPEVQPCGLGARDSLRLEAGLCLYGNDIDEETTPSEAGLTWTVAKTRRGTPSDSDTARRSAFLGAEVILAQIADPSKVTRKRVGFVLQGGPPARGDESVFAADTAAERQETPIGRVTSGGFSPSLNTGIGMAYLDKSATRSGTPVMIRVRGKAVPGTVTKMPFVPTHYYQL